MAWLTNDLRPDRSKPQGLIVNSRILWAFSALHRVRPEPPFQEAALTAYRILRERFWDAQAGGAFWRLDNSWRVLDDAKKIYGQAFCIYALTEYYQAFQDRVALETAMAVFELIESHAHDPEFQGYLEACRRDWSPAEDLRLSDKDMNEKKSMNNHLHVLEAYTNLYRVWKDPRVACRLRELIHVFLHRILDADAAHFHHFFDERWSVRSDTCTFGHDIEGSWLLCEAADTLGDADLVRRVRETALRIAGAVLGEGIDPSGALCYEGRGGVILDPRRECWPQAEAVVGFLNAAALSGDQDYLRAALGVWDFIENHLADRVHGEWFWRINLDGKPDQDLPKVSEWKGPYHGTRCCLETLHRLESFIS
jgi:mannobiose 2-epimerase